MNKILLLFLLSFLLIGCVNLSKEYTPKEEPLKYVGEKYSVSYSVDDYYKGLEVLSGRASTEEWKKKINDRLLSSGAFDSVLYKPSNMKSPYHIGFEIYGIGASPNDALWWGLLSGYSVFTIPISLDMYLDINAIVYLDGMPIYSICAAEKVVRTAWAPLVFLGIFWNDFVSWNYIEGKSLDYIINHILENQKQISEKYND